jgi:hypothetical protein
MTLSGIVFLDCLSIFLAYLDPGSGSVIFQVLLGALAASGVAVSLMWRQARTFAARVFCRRSSADHQGK